MPGIAGRAVRELASGQVIGGRFTLVGKLSSGGHGEVWRAREHPERREIALKILFPAVAALPGAYASLEREYAISRRLRAPGILEVFPPLADRQATALPMAMATGGDLRRFRGRDYLVVVPLLIELARALEFAHAHGVVHRDLKPGNVLLDAAGHVKLADFAVAAVDGKAPAGARGSPFSLSPQQLAGEPPAPADDLYGFGTIAYELLSGFPPFHPKFDRQRVFNAPVPVLRPAWPCPIRLTTLVMRLLNKRPIDRPASMAVVIEALEEALGDTPPFEVERAAAEPDRFATAPAPPAPPAPPALPAPSPQRAAADPPRWPEGRALAGLTPMPPPRRGYALLGVLVAAAAGLTAFARPGGLLPPRSPERAQLVELRRHFEQRLAVLDARAAGDWGGAAFRAAQAEATSASAALDAGDAAAAERHWEAGLRDLAEVTMREPSAPAGP
jgi:serine/threonine-protein kinase